MQFLINILAIIMLAVSPYNTMDSTTYYGVKISGFQDCERLKTEIQLLAKKLNEITGIPEQVIIPIVFGENLEITFTQKSTPNYSSYNCWSTLNCYGTISPLDDPDSYGLFIHEFGHRFLNGLNLSYTDLNMQLDYIDINNQYVHIAGINYQTGQFERTCKGFIDCGQPYIQHGPLSPDFNSYREDFADMFMNWVLDQFSDNIAGQMRNNWMNDFVKSHIWTLIRQNGYINIRLNNRYIETRYIQGVDCPSDCNWHLKKLE